MESAMPLLMPVGVFNIDDLCYSCVCKIQAHSSLINARIIYVSTDMVERQFIAG
jgi:hypothetical protein